MSAARLAVISNRRSTRNASSLKHVRQALAAYPGEVLHRELDDIAEVPEILADFADFDPDVLVINGGDGTVQAVLTASSRNKPFGALPPILVLPGGHTNLIAEDLGAFALPEKIFGRFAPALASGEWEHLLTKRPLLKMKLTPDAEPVFGAFFGTAAIVRGLEFVRRKIHPFGWPTWLEHLVGITIIFFAGLFNRHGPNSPVRADEATIHIEGEAEIRYRHFVIMATTLNRLLLGLKPFPSNGAPYSLKVTSVDYSFGSIARGMLAILSRSIDRKVPAGMIAEHATKAEIRIDWPVTLAGEFFTPDPDRPIEISQTRPVAFLRLARG